MGLKQICPRIGLMMDARDCRFCDALITSKGNIDCKAKLEKLKK